ncbi:hypothetical protein ABTK02_22365, partial [Acinetobacter baumannii]
MNKTQDKTLTRTLVMLVYIAFTLVPLYWLLNTSLKTNEETLSVFTLWPNAPTLNNYKTIFTDP